MVQCVGYNYYGQLGQSSSDTFGTPVLLNFLNTITAKPKKVVTGYDHACTLFDDGHVWCNGSNGFGQLGNGLSVNSATPVQVKENSSVVLANVIDIEAGAYHNCAIQDTGAMYCWGFNNKGQLGLNDIMDGSANDNKAVKMALSLISTCVITGTETNPSKSATCVGKGFTSENASTTIDLVNDVRKLTAGSHHFCALLVGDTAKCWGANNAGQLGIGSKDLSPRYNTAETVRASPSTPILSNIADINAGYLSTCLVLANGSPMCFGNNRFYQLGIANGGANELYPKSLSIAPVSGKTLVSIYVGEQTGHAIYDDDSIYSMGTNHGGTFGDGSTVSSRNVVGDIPGAITRQMEFSLGTNSPSNIPSLQPSSGPSLLPSDSPSDQPSSIPSSLPSALPSLSPSDRPTSVPSSIPSDLPSDNPSDQPSSIPSSLPSALPSLIHSSEPSDTPSLIHSSKPSEIPSLQTSSSPSLIPSDTPSLIHSSEPSDTPSLVHSSSPSLQPSLSPSLTPSLTPSASSSPSISTQPSNTPTVNVARKTAGGVASQSSTGGGFGAGKAIDGNLDINWSKGSSSTYWNDSNPNPWWQVHFSQSYEIQLIKIYFKSNTGNRLLDSPSALPSSAPSSGPSSSPSDFPWLSPSSHPSLLPSNTPSLQPSSSPSSIPSDLPPLSPSSNPSQDPYLLGDENSHITFDNIDFGSTNSVKGIKITYTNGEQNDTGSIEIKLGDASGATLAQFSPPGTLSWVDVSNTMLIPFDNTVQLSGMNSLTFITTETTATMHLISYELIDLSERFTPFTTINATEVSDQNGIGASNGDSGFIDNGDYFMYSPIDFGITFAKDTTGGRLEIRKGGVDGEIIGNYLPVSTGGWEVYQTVDIPIKTTFGINELTFIARDLTYGLMGLKSFQLSPITAGYICLDTTARTNIASVQAAASAQAGSSLVFIRCSAQQNAVASMPVTTGTWIGGTDAANEGTWVFPDRSAMTYFNWNTGEPNNAGGNEDCIVMATSGKWVDGPCNSAATTGPAIFESTSAITGLTCNEYVECQDTVKIVENGVQTSDTRLRNNNLATQSDTAGAYLSEPGRATATNTDNWNVYNLPIGTNNDFAVLAKLKVDGTGSAAGFIINDGDLFGFNGCTNSNGIFGEGAFSGVITSHFGTYSDLFYFKVERKLGTIKFYINEQEVASFANYNVSVAKFSWRPWRAELKIYDFTISGPSLLYFGFSSVFNGYSFLIDAANTNSYTGSGTVVSDLISGTQGQLVGSTFFDASSVKSFVLNGSTDYIQFGNIGTFTSATFTCWVTRSGPDSNYTGLLIYRSSNVSGIGIMSTGKIWYFWNNKEFTHDSDLSAPIGEWTMITVTFGAGVAKFYKNEAQGISHTYNNSPTTMTNMNLGVDTYPSTERFFNGQIATAAIYNRALSASEVTQLYNDSKARYQ
ncbi:hypothetical protein CTEN210_04227 [Chaetoceros tenuissimus]|uniref:C-type lectin domain-containing protein n=1 Tax=Chaetoceros tenuissimus TaxID=426638 RepID=A0AAD3CKJ1_9STRA|nr:hypothetical protein CTEN210_04227 [Chaetoceros tenuissimus]